MSLAACGRSLTTFSNSSFSSGWSRVYLANGPGLFVPPGVRVLPIEVTTLEVGSVSPLAASDMGVKFKRKVQKDMDQGSQGTIFPSK